jgi:hypothetical protein
MKNAERYATKLNYSAESQPDFNKIHEVISGMSYMDKWK